MPDQPTPFAEANALLALQNGDHVEASKILADSPPDELRKLAVTANRLNALCWTLHDEKLAEERQRRAIHE